MAGRQANAAANAAAYSPQFFSNAVDQQDSPLFKLPGELRNRIYTFALAAFEDRDRLYDPNTYWYRPNYSAPRRSNVTLLRTCKRVYRETWFKPWSLADHTFWLASIDRMPTGSMSHENFAQVLDLMYQHQGNVELEHVRFFAQMYILESDKTDGAHLRAFLNLSHFQPVVITITIRHTDWWFWESDDHLRIRSVVFGNKKVPTSTRRVCLELETLERKKDQLNSIVDQMKSSWHVTKTDGSILSARRTDVGIERWRGSSSWAGQRWIRDEVEPETLDYYVATVTFEHEHDVVADDVAALPDLYSAITPSLLPRRTVASFLLAQAQVPPGTRGDTALQMVQEHQRLHASARHSAAVRRPGVRSIRRALPQATAPTPNQPPV